MPLNGPLNLHASILACVCVRTNVCIYIVRVPKAHLISLLRLGLGLDIRIQIDGVETETILPFIIQRFHIAIIVVVVIFACETHSLSPLPLSGEQMSKCSVIVKIKWKMSLLTGHWIF